MSSDIANFRTVLNIVNEEYPLKIELDDKTNLTRKILYIPLDEEQEINTNTSISDVEGITNFGKLNETEQKNQINELLDILDNNLGEKYSKVSEDIYGNKLNWKLNKIEEMKTNGLIYIIYFQDDKAKLFLSIMLTEEEGLIKTEPTEFSNVIYIYEIQILNEFRGLNLGTRLISDYLVKCCSRIKNICNLPFDFKGIELTVFSDNISAIKFYEKIGMQLTENSPMDNIKLIRSRKILIKPVYYLFILPI